MDLSGGKMGAEAVLSSTNLPSDGRLHRALHCISSYPFLFDMRPWTVMLIAIAPAYIQSVTVIV
jgi:hypothetical protein